MKKTRLLMLAVLISALLFPCCAHGALLTELSVSTHAYPAVLSEAGTVDVTVSVRLDTGVIGDSITVLSASCQGVSTETPVILPYNQSMDLILKNVPVSESQLGSPMKVELLYIDLDGQLVTQSRYFTVNAPESSVSISRLFDPAAPKVGDMVRLLYLVSNSGETDVSDVRIVDDEFGQVMQSEFLGAGQQQSVEYTFIMPNQDLISSGTVEYISSTGEPLSKVFEPLEISRQKFALSVMTQVDCAQLTYGEAFWLGCTVSNNGRVDYHHVTLHCDYLGDLPEIDVLESGASCTVGRWITPAASRKYVIEVSGTDESGETYSISAQPLIVQVDQAPVLDDRVLHTQIVQAELLASADQTHLQKDGLVSFEITVSHPDVTLQDVYIRENTLGQLEKIEMLPSGDQLFKYSEHITDSGTYQFSLSAKDANGVSVLALSEPIEITVDEPENSVSMAVLSPAVNAVPPAPKREIIETAVLFGLSALMVLSAVLLTVLILREKIRKPKS